MASLPYRSCLATTSLYPPLSIARDENPFSEGVGSCPSIPCDVNVIMGSSGSSGVSWPQELHRQTTKAVVPASYAHNLDSNDVCKSQRWISFNPPQFYSFHSVSA